MGYWLDASLNYYEGAQRSSADTAVDQRPFPTMDWTAGAWVYDLPDTRIYVKNTYNRAMEADITSALSESSNPNNIQSIIGGAFLMADIAAYTDNAANNCPFIDGYRAISGESKAAAFASLTGYADVVAAVYGKCIAQRRADYADIDAATTGPDIRAIVYVRPF